MGFFNFFGDDEHRVFNYKPMYYDKEKEDRMRKFKAVDGSMDAEKKDGEYVPGTFTGPSGTGPTRAPATG